MAYLILLRNPLTPHEKEEHELQPGETPIEWLQEHHPDGFGMPIRFYVNADEKSLDELDYMPDIDDIIIIALMPGGFLAAMPLLVKVVIGLAVMAAAYFAMQLFAPKVPKQGKQAEEKETFSVSSDQNSAKYGDPIPVVYGEVWMTPDYITQPYTWYKYAENAFNELMSGVQYLDVIMCVGQGYVSVSDVKVGESTASSLGAEIVKWRTFYPNEHNSRMGVISAAMGEEFHENVVTSTEVDNQEFIKPGDLTPFYTICKAGAKGSTFVVDVIFPNGLYNVTGKGDLKGTSTTFDVLWGEVKDDGTWMGIEGRVMCLVNSTGNGAANDGKNLPEVSNPIRRSFPIRLNRSARWAVQIVRTGKSLPPNEGQTTFVWSGLKLIADNAPKAYGDVTLLACRIKASRGIGSEAAVRVSAKCRRWQGGLPDGNWQQTTSPADAFYDIYTNTAYGAGRPVGELDMQKLRTLKYNWYGYEFNHVFRNRTTVWEALKTTIVGQAAEPLPLGSVMTIAQDGVKPLRSMLFTDANIVEGSMKVNYIFDIDDDTDGIEVQYIDPLDWRESFTRYPLTSVVPEQVTLEGCTSAKHAAQYARLVWQRTRGQRKRITFDTELEGIILQLGDRIAISHDMPKWGDNGLVLGMRGNEIICDHDLDWSGGGKFMMFRQEDGSPSSMFSVTQGAQPNIAVLGSSIYFPTHFDDDYDYTAFAFGTATKMIRDFTVATTKHTGDTTVTVEAVNYAPEIFDGAMTFLGGAP